MSNLLYFNFGYWLKMEFEKDLFWWKFIGILVGGLLILLLIYFIMCKIEERKDIKFHKYMINIRNTNIPLNKETLIEINSLKEIEYIRKYESKDKKYTLITIQFSDETAFCFMLKDDKFKNLLLNEKYSLEEVINLL